jgi:hypothetical protein
VEKNSIIFIGVLQNKQKMEFKSKPSFFDAVQLSSQSPQTIMDTPYQAIPFFKKANIPIHLINTNIRITYHNHSLQITKDGNNLTEKEVFEIFNYFAIKEDNRVSFLTEFPLDNTSRKKRKTIRFLVNGKKLEE